MAEPKNYALSKDPKEQVELIVRKGEKYGESLPGERVIVDRSEAKHLCRRGMGGEQVGPLMTLEEHEKLEAKKAAAKAKKKPASGLKKMVEEGLARLGREAENITKKRKEELSKVDDDMAKASVIRRVRSGA